MQSRLKFEFKIQFEGHSVAPQVEQLAHKIRSDAFIVSGQMYSRILSASPFGG